MKPTSLDFGSILSEAQTQENITPQNIANLQLALSVALRDYISATSPEALNEITFLGAFRIQFNFKLQTLSHYASGVKSDARYCTQSNKPLKGLKAVVDVTYGAP